MMASIACSLHLRPTCVLTPSRTLGVDPLSCYLLHQGICPRDNNHIREPHCSSDGNSYQCPQNPSDLHEQCNNLFLEQDTRAFVVSLFEPTPPLLNSLQDWSLYHYPHEMHLHQQCWSEQGHEGIVHQVYQFHEKRDDVKKEVLSIITQPTELVLRYRR